MTEFDEHAKVLSAHSNAIDEIMSHLYAEHREEFIAVTLAGGTKTYAQILATRSSNGNDLDISDEI